VVIEVALRLQRLAEAPSAAAILAVLPAESPAIGSEGLVRSSTTIEQVYDDASSAGEGPLAARWAAEATYEGTVRFEESQLEHPDTIEPMVDALTRWVASTLVQLADLPLHFLPAEPAGDH
ncbi:MAG TPA: hypothetical protein VKG43_07240, partial [Acidimicrobiales bacterium]|nr:hypothetical protein [Acidimicrobiales bacterium]